MINQYFLKSSKAIFIVILLFLCPPYSYAVNIVLDSKKSPKSAQETYSDLIVLQRLHPTTNFQIHLEFKVLKQYRTSANPWESFWIFWSYNKDSLNLKYTNYLIFKSNGLEIGKAYNEISQDFIYTDANVKIELEKWYPVDLYFVNDELTIQIDGKKILIEKNKIMQCYRLPGRIGLYAEDSRVLIKNFRLNYK